VNTTARYIIAEIGDADFDPSFTPPKTLADYGVRKASRGILINNGKMALLFVSKENYHKLPGGGIEAGETNNDAFVREVQEETGCDCKVLDEDDQNSVVIETRDQFKLLQISYAFFSEIVGEPKELHLEQSEIDEGFELKWIPVDQVINLLENDKPKNYEGNFIRARDLAILNFYKDKLKIKNDSN
jgi:8-oxo-dGTP pyrophosphatase MutT (NUDIX family)